MVDIKELENKTILFLGIGGVSMHQLAIACKHLGAKVLGYDAKQSAYTDICGENGILITHKFNKVFCDVDICVKTAAISEKNEFIIQLKLRGVKILDRAELLGLLCSTFKCVIAVAGTHGKTTTASLIYEMLRRSNNSVSCHIGGDVKNPRFNIGDDFLVVEACEYNKSFLSLSPDVAVVTNIEKDHLDCYKNLFNIRLNFIKFLRRAKEKFVFLDKSTSFLQKYKNFKFVDLKTSNLPTHLKGEYNLKNISLAVAVAKNFKVSENDIDFVVENFKGVSRRFECLARLNNTTFFADYAHHPSEIEAFASTLASEHKKSLIVFQPHTYSRTKLLLSDFLRVLSKIKNLVILKEYPARENKGCGISAHELYLLLKDKNPSSSYASNIKKIKNNFMQFDAVAFVGAGDIYEKAKNFLMSFKKNG